MPMTAGYQEFMERRRFGSLDGLRCFCILAVIWHHTPGSHGINITFLQRGFLGVDMFFVLSGFLITTLLIRERAKHGCISLRAFWIRRSLRIFPIYYISLFLIVIAYLVLRRGDPETQALLSDLPFHAFYLSNWRHDIAANLDPLWSLGTEEQFYVFWPLVEAFAIAPVRRVVLALLILINVLIATRIGVPMLFEGGVDHPIFTLSIMQTTFLPILLGVALAHLLHDKRWYAVISFFVSWRWAPVVWAGILVALIQFSPGDIQGWPRIVIQLSMTAMIASTVTQQTHAMTGFLSFGLFRRMGEISYGMYLFHKWAIDIEQRGVSKIGSDFDLWPVVHFVIIVLLTVAVSEASFRLIESPILRFKKRFTRVDMGREEPVGDDEEKQDVRRGAESAEAAKGRECKDKK